MSGQLQDTGSLTDTASVDLEDSALDIASWEIESWEMESWEIESREIESWETESWEIESASDSEDLNCSVGLDQNILSVSFLVEEIEDLEGSDDGAAGLTGSTTIYPGPAGLDLHEEYFSRYIDSTLTHLAVPANEQDREDSITVVAPRIRNVVQDQFSLHPVFLGPSPPSQTAEEILASFTRPNILALKLDKEDRYCPICWKEYALESSSSAKANESPTQTSSPAVETTIVPKEMVGSDTVIAVRADCAHLCCEACMRIWLEMEKSSCPTCRAYLT